MFCASMNNGNNPLIFQRTIVCCEIIDLVSAKVHTTSGSKDCIERSGTPKKAHVYITE